MSAEHYINKYPSLDNLLTFAGATALSWMVTWVLLRAKSTLGVDRPDHWRKQHEKPISRLGGLPIFMALTAGFLFMEIRFSGFLARWKPMIISNCLIFAVGFIDDVKPQ